MDFGVELIPCRFDGFYSVLLQIFDEFLIDELHALAYFGRIIDLRACIKSALEVVDYRQ